MKGLVGNQKGQALAIVLCLLAIGGLTIATILTYMTTGIKSVQINEKKTSEFYATDAGVEDAIHKIITSDEALQNLDAGGIYSYTLAEAINSIAPVSVNVTKLSLLDGILDPSEYKLDAPHEGWFSFDIPTVESQTEEYIEYYCNLAVHNTGGSNRQIQTMGVFFSPFPGDENLIVGPSDIVYTVNITDEDLEAGSPETIIAAEGFSFLWRWTNNQGPELDDGDTGALSFTLRVYDPTWEYSVFFAFATTKEQDVSFITSNPSPYKWLIEATAAGTKVSSSVIQYSMGLAITSWEIK
ncbi:hypothetical protein ACFLT8_02635 [Chloroflexota bacterium]